jgi:hypothetical protein
MRRWSENWRRRPSLGLNLCSGRGAGNTGRAWGGASDSSFWTWTLPVSATHVGTSNPLSGSGFDRRPSPEVGFATVAKRVEIGADIAVRRRTEWPRNASSEKDH